MKRSKTFFLICLGVILLSACKPVTPAPTETFAAAAEHPVTYLELTGPVAASRAEVSAMAWCGDRLILVPQYPAMFKNEGQACVFAIPKADIVAYLDDSSTEPLEPTMIPFEAGDLTKQIDGFEGFEAVTFDGDTVYMTIESRDGNAMVGYLVKGSVTGDCAGIVMDTDVLTPIQPQADLSNMTDETIIVYEDRIYTVYEANGVNVNPDPVAHVFKLDLAPVGETPFPSIEYRITDATVPDADGLFWAINYFYPGDTKLKPGTDEIAVQYSLGESHQEMEQVERLVALQITDEGIVFAGIAPINLELDPSLDDSRNWEGLVRFGEGFLLVTDEYPTTILGYVER
jgi:hypothetical protein